MARTIHRSTQEPLVTPARGSRKTKRSSEQDIRGSQLISIGVLTKKRQIRPPDQRKNGAGAPSKYCIEYAEMAEEMVARLGATHEEIARVFKCTVDAIRNWIEFLPEFAIALKRGKDRYDNTRVEAALRNRALGYEYEEITVEEITLTQGRGEDRISVPAIKTTRHIKQRAPDVVSCMFWLQNRNPDRWRNVSHVQVSGEGGGPIRHIDESMSQKDATNAYLDMLSTTNAN